MTVSPLLVKVYANLDALKPIQQTSLPSELDRSTVLWSASDALAPAYPIARALAAGVRRASALADVGVDGGAGLVDADPVVAASGAVQNHAVVWISTRVHVTTGHAVVGTIGILSLLRELLEAGWTGKSFGLCLKNRDTDKKYIHWKSSY